MGGQIATIINQEAFYMTMVIRDNRGMRVSAVLLAASRRQMRVAVRSQADTVELNCVDGCWYMESGAPVEIEEMVPVPETNFAGFCAQVYPLTHAAGRPGAC